MSKVYQCHRCGGTFVPNDSLKVACAVLHGVDDCCHYGEQQISKLPNPSVSIDKDELRSEIEFRLSMADVPQKHIKIASNSMEDLITAQQKTLLDKLEAQSSLTTSTLGWISKKLDEHMLSTDNNGMKSLVLMQLIKDKTATQEQREEWDALVTERRALAIITGLAKQAAHDQKAVHQLRQELNGEKV